MRICQNTNAALQRKHYSHYLEYLFKKYMINDVRIQSYFVKNICKYLKKTLHLLFGIYHYTDIFKSKKIKRFPSLYKSNSSIFFFTRLLNLPLKPPSKVVPMS